MLLLDEIRQAFGVHEPRCISEPGRRRAAVAVVLRERAGTPEVLFIERAEHEGDPWSGHMAFPGGRVDPEDESPRLAAERETREEVGVDLAGAESLGRLDDMQGHHAAASPSLVISAFVYHVEKPLRLEPNSEVADAFWFPVGSLLDPDRHVQRARRESAGPQFPGILVGVPERQVVWGLTYRFLEGFFQIVGRPLPDRWQTTRGQG